MENALLPTDNVFVILASAVMIALNVNQVLLAPLVNLARDQLEALGVMDMEIAPRVEPVAYVHASLDMVAQTVAVSLIHIRLYPSSLSNIIPACCRSPYILCLSTIWIHRGKRGYNHQRFFSR